MVLLVLFTAQIFAPLAVAQAQSEGNETARASNLTLSVNLSENHTVKATIEESEKNKITFVLGTEENLASLVNTSVNATVNTTVDVTIYNAAEAMLLNFSNESVVFLASLHNDTVASINSTINSSAHVFAYNLSTNISIGNVEDINITKYWVYSGDENIRNLILYMNNTFYGGTTPVNSAKAPFDHNEFLFVMGTDVNEVALQNAALNATIASELNVTIFTKKDTVPEDLNFSNYSVIFIESQNETVIAGWNASITSAKASGSMVIGYNLSSNITVPNVDLGSTNYTDIERYWIQGGDTNMESMLKFMGQKFCDAWVGEDIPDPVLLQPKTKLLFIMNFGTYYVNKVYSEKTVIQDLFEITVYTGEEGEASTESFADCDVIYIRHLGASTMYAIEDRLREAKAAGAYIPTFMEMVDVWGISNVNISEPAYAPISGYVYEGGETNTENWIRWSGAIFNDVYIQYKPPQEVPRGPSKGIYRPETYPKVFDNSTEYLEWYADHGYNASNLTVGIIGWEYAAITALESRGVNVIAAHTGAIQDGAKYNDTHYFTDEEDNVLVDVILSFKGFYLYYGNPPAGKDRLATLNVPVIKVVSDYYSSSDEWEDSIMGLNLKSIPFQVVQPEIDGTIEYIWVKGRTTDPVTGKKYYEYMDYQLEWLCDRAIGLGNLRRMDNSDKHVAIIYYNHGGGKNNIGASYLDISQSMPLLLSAMKKSGYDLGEDELPTTGKEIIGLFMTSRNVGSWAPGELEKVVESGYVELVPVDDYLEWYSGTFGEVPENVRKEIEEWWGAPPGRGMVYNNQFVIPLIKFGNVLLVPQPMIGGQSNETMLYHNTSVPVPHQYFAFYLWLGNKFDADAIIHFGTHGTQEWRPGKQVGLSRYDNPPLMVQDMPVVYPYIMDNVGEGTQAKRRGNAVMIDHLTPPIVPSDLYDEFLALTDKMESYENAADPALKQSYRNSIIELYDSLDLELDLNLAVAQVEAMSETKFDDFLETGLHDYLLDLRDEMIPYGLHIFGLPPNDAGTVGMVKSMLRDSYIKHVEDVVGKDTGFSTNARDKAEYLLSEVLINGTNITIAQNTVLGATSDNVTSNLKTALDFAERLDQTTREINQTLRALSAEFIRSEPGGDPIRSPDALPTGNNFYSFDPRKIPNEEAEAMGMELANTFLQMYNDTHGEYPQKVGFVLWSVETMRHQGIFEAQIYGLLGVKPVRSSGRITGFEVIPLEELGRPRIDVVLAPSGLYRDTFPNHVELFDEAIRTVAELDEPNDMNYVKARSEAINATLIEMGYDSDTAQFLSKSRIFIDAPGTYGGGGIAGVVGASYTWENESKVADRYISGQGYVYGGGLWGEPNEDLFRLNLVDVDAALHSDSSNLYGLMDNDDMFQYFGAMALAVRSLRGGSPDMYITNLQKVDRVEMTTLEGAYRLELRARYFNPKWIQGMMEYDYAGAREMDHFVEHLWGWDVTLPEMVSDMDWNRAYDIYVQDKYDLGMKEFFDSNNPYAFQSITARMLEAVRKDYWDAPDEIAAQLAKQYMESVVEYGVTCCHHTCGNFLINDYMEGLMNVPDGPIDQTLFQQYLDKMAEARGEVPEEVPEKAPVYPGGGSRRITEEETDEGVTNMTEMVGVSKEGEELKKPPEKTAEEKKGKVMKEEKPVEKPSPAFPISGAPLMGIIAVIVVLVLIGIGLGYKRRRR